MNILILINNAPKYINFLKPLGDIFKSNGHNVIYACESHLPEILYGTSLEVEKTYYFTNHTKEVDRIQLKEYEKSINLRSFYYSCFDRNYHHNVNNQMDKNLDSIIYRLLDFYEEIIKKESVDLVLYENVSNSFAYAAYIVAKKHNKKYFGFITSRMPNRFEIWEDEYGEIDRRGRLFEELDWTSLSSDEVTSITKYIESIKGNNVKPDYMKNNPMSMKVNYLSYYIKKLNIINKYIHYYTDYKDDVGTAYQSAYPLKASYKYVLRNFKRKAKLSKLKSYYDEFDSDNEKYFLLPLHYQPESSTSVNAIFYDNQYEFIKNTAFSLPLGTALYVKDHPNGIGFAGMDFYKKLKRLPNVKYINPLSDTKELISKSQCIITLTSTMGYEALLLEKPVITMGKVFYNYHPYCYKLNGYNEMYKIIKQVLDDSDNRKEFFHYNIKFLSIYIKDTFEGKVFNSESDFQGIYKAVLEKLKEV